MGSGRAEVQVEWETDNTMGEDRGRGRGEKEVVDGQGTVPVGS